MQRPEIKAKKDSDNKDEEAIKCYSPVGYRHLAAWLVNNSAQFLSSTSLIDE